MKHPYEYWGPPELRDIVQFRDEIIQLAASRKPSAPIVLRNGGAEIVPYDPWEGLEDLKGLVQECNLKIAERQRQQQDSYERYRDERRERHEQHRLGIERVLEQKDG